MTQDKESIKALTSLLKKYPLTKKETEAVREAIGLLSWAKLMEGYMNRKKKARDLKLQDDERTSFE